MKFEGPGGWPAGMLCPVSITLVALSILEAPNPTTFDMSPTEDPKINMIFDIANDDFKHDFDLLWEVPANFSFLKESERIAWAEDRLSKARTEKLRALSPYDLMRTYLLPFS